MQCNPISIGVASYEELGHVPPLDLQKFKFFRILWPIQSLTATICRQSAIV